MTALFSSFPAEAIVAATVSALLFKDDEGDADLSLFPLFSSFSRRHRHRFLCRYFFSRPSRCSKRRRPLHVTTSFPFESCLFARRRAAFPSRLAVPSERDICPTTPPSPSPTTRSRRLPNVVVVSKRRRRRRRRRRGEEVEEEEVFGPKGEASLCRL